MNAAMVSENVMIYFNVYTEELASALLKDLSFVNSEAGYHEGQGYRVARDGQSMTLGDYGLTEVIPIQEIVDLYHEIDADEEESMLQLSILRPRIHDVGEVLLAMGMCLDIHGGKLIDALCNHMPIFNLRTRNEV